MENISKQIKNPAIKCRFCGRIARVFYGYFLQNYSNLALCTRCRNGLEEFFDIKIKVLVSRIERLEAENVRKKKSR